MLGNYLQLRAGYMCTRVPVREYPLANFLLSPGGCHCSHPWDGAQSRPGAFPRRRDQHRQLSLLDRRQRLLCTDGHCVCPPAVPSAGSCAASNRSQSIQWGDSRYYIFKHGPDCDANAPGESHTLSRPAQPQRTTGGHGDHRLRDFPAAKR